MWCMYSYLMKNFKDLGPYQADVEDFKKFFKNQIKNLRAVCVYLQDGRVYIWNQKVQKNNRTAGGWELVKGKN